MKKNVSALAAKISAIVKNNDKKALNDLLAACYYEEDAMKILQQARKAHMPEKMLEAVYNRHNELVSHWVWGQTPRRRCDWDRPSNHADYDDYSEDSMP